MKTSLFASKSQNKIFNISKKILLLAIMIFNLFMCAAAAESKKTDNEKQKETQKSIINIAVIGASFSGCSVSYFLNKAFEKHNEMYKLNITIFDKNPKLKVNFPAKKVLNTIADTHYPFIFEWQTNLKKLLKDLDLEPRKYNQSNSIGVFDGEEFLVNESNKNFVNKLKQLYPEDMAKMLAVLHKFHKSLQNVLSASEADNGQVSSLTDFIGRFKGVFSDFKSLFTDRADVFLNNFEINFSFLDKIIRGFLYANSLKGADNNAFSSLLAILGQLNNKYCLENGLVSLADKLVYDNPYYNINTFLKFNSIVKRIEENNNKTNINDKTQEDLHIGATKAKSYTITALNAVSGKLEDFNYFDLVIFSDKCEDFSHLEIIDADFTKDKKEQNFGFTRSFKTLYNHLLLGNIQKDFFYQNSHLNEKNKKNPLPSSNEFENELVNLASKINEDPNNASNYNRDNESYNNYLNKENENLQNLPDTILVNDNQGFSDFSLIQPLCKNCYLNRFYDENKQKFNSVVRIVSAHEKLSDALIKKVFNGRVVYESNKGERFSSIERKGNLSSNDNSNNFNNNNRNNNMPEFEICKRRLFNNLALSYLDDNLEFDLISSKIIANLVLKNYVKDELDILSSDF